MARGEHDRARSIPANAPTRRTRPRYRKRKPLQMPAPAPAPLPMAPALPDAFEREPDGLDSAPIFAPGERVKVLKIYL